MFLNGPENQFLFHAPFKMKKNVVVPKLRLPVWQQRTHFVLEDDLYREGTVLLYSCRNKWQVGQGKKFCCMSMNS